MGKLFDKFLYEVFYVPMLGRWWLELNERDLEKERMKNAMREVLDEKSRENL